LPLFQEICEEFLHCSLLLSNLPLFLFFRIFSLVNEFMVRNVLDLNVKHVYHSLDECFGVELGKQNDHMRQRHLVFLEYLLGQSVSAFYDKVIKTFFLLQTHILFSVKATRGTFQIIFE